MNIAEPSRKRRLSRKIAKGKLSKRRSVAMKIAEPSRKIRLSRKRVRDAIAQPTTVPWYRAKTKNNNNERKKTRLTVSSYEDFQTKLKDCVFNKWGPVSFDVSDDVDSESYGKILGELLYSNKEFARLDKIKHPRSNHRPPPIVSCKNTKEMIDAYHAIGPYYRVIMLEPDDSFTREQKKKIFGDMESFLLFTGILDDSAPL